jgi:hypothetical protein
MRVPDQEPQELQFHPGHSYEASIDSHEERREICRQVPAAVDPGRRRLRRGQTLDELFESPPCVALDVRGDQAQIGARLEGGKPMLLRPQGNDQQDRQARQSRAVAKHSAQLESVQDRKALAHDEQVRRPFGQRDQYLVAAGHPFRFETEFIERVGKSRRPGRILVGDKNEKTILKARDQT